MDTMAKEIVISRSGLTALEQELEELKTVRRKDVAEKIKTARGLVTCPRTASTTRPRMNRPLSRAGSPSWRPCSSTCG